MSCAERPAPGSVCDSLAFRNSGREKLERVRGSSPLAPRLSETLGLAGVSPVIG